jgi:hypothetical protein
MFSEYMLTFRAEEPMKICVYFIFRSFNIKNAEVKIYGLRNFQQAVVSLLFEPELQTRARWKGEN